MPEYSVVCPTLGGGFYSMLSARLKHEAIPSCHIAPFADGARVSVGKNDVPKLARAIAGLMLCELRLYELARFAACLPAELRSSRALLPRAAALTSGEKRLGQIVPALIEYLSENRFIAVDGFLRFRLQQTEEEWALAVERAGEELLLFKQRIGLLRLLACVAEAEFAEEMRSVRLILHSDGTAVLTDKKRCRIESAAAEEASILGMLTGLGPGEIEVYDLSEGKRQGLIGSIVAVFGNKAHIFTQKNNDF